MNKQKKLLAILGSPHQNGTTANMLNQAVKCAENAGWEVHKIWLYEKQISYCTGCRACIKLGHCVHEDDISEIAGWLQNCDTVLLSCPTYWANVPAAVKNMFDRLLGTAMEETSRLPKPRLSPKQNYILFTSCNTPFPFSVLFGQSSGALKAMTEFFKYSGMKCSGKLALTGPIKSDHLRSEQEYRSKTEVVLSPKTIRKIERFFK